MEKQIAELRGDGRARPPASPNPALVCSRAGPPASQDPGLVERQVRGGGRSMSSGLSVRPCEAAGFSRSRGRSGLDRPAVRAQLSAGRGDCAGRSAALGPRHRAARPLFAPSSRGPRPVCRCPGSAGCRPGRADCGNVTAVLGAEGPASATASPFLRCETLSGYGRGGLPGRPLAWVQTSLPHGWRWYKPTEG